MDRAEATGFGVATLGHAALLAALTLGFANVVRPPVMNDPMEVEFVDEVGLESAAPVPSLAEAAPRLAETEGPVEPVAPPPTPPPPIPVPEPLPQPKAVEPAPAPKAVERPKPPKPAPAKAKAAPAKAPPQKAAPAKAAPPKQDSAAKAKSQPKGRLSGILTGISDRETASRATAPPAQKAGPAVQASLVAAVRRQVKPHWKAPTGADVELLRTELSIRLAKDGSVTDIDVLRTTGQNASNRPQVKLHQEQAVKAVRLASPFNLPAEYYDAWKHLSPFGFDKRLSQ
jgi:outer membrane biosynthesis protein TonB